MNLEERAREILLDLVSAYSPSGREGEAAQVLVDHARALGLDAHRDRVGNTIVDRPDVDDSRPTVALLGHIDTVPGRLEVAAEDGVVHGRGAVDAKGPLVAHLLALATLEDPPVRPRLVGAVGEETDSRGARHLEGTMDPDGLVIAEPTGRDTVGLGYKGRMLARLQAQAEPAHPGEPSPTASERLLEAIDRWTEATGNPERSVGFDETTLRVRDLDAETGVHTDRAEALVDVRFPEEIPDLEAIAGLVPEGVEVDVEEAIPGVRADAKNPLATGLRASLRVHDTKARQAVKTGTSDWNVVARSWSCPAVAYGPGEADLDHSPNERIAVQALVEAAEVLAGALERLPPERLAPGSR